jgi:hypothetical protein
MILTTKYAQSTLSRTNGVFLTRQDKFYLSKNKSLLSLYQQNLLLQII